MRLDGQRRQRLDLSLEVSAELRWVGDAVGRKEGPCCGGVGSVELGLPYRPGEVPIPSSEEISHASEQSMPVGSRAWGYRYTRAAVR